VERDNTWKYDVAGDEAGRTKSIFYWKLAVMFSSSGKELITFHGAAGDTAFKAYITSSVVLTSHAFQLGCKI
jgi:hypothetical protein